MLIDLHETFTRGVSRTKDQSINGLWLMIRIMINNFDRGLHSLNIIFSQPFFFNYKTWAIAIEVRRPR